MALLFVDGFDHSGTSLTIHATKYSSFTTGNANMVSTPVRTGTGAYQLSGTGGALNRVIPSIPMGSPFFVGFAFRKTLNSPSNTRLITTGQNGVVNHIGIGTEPGGKLIIFRDTTTTIIATGTTVLLLNSWYYIEFKGIIHDTTGSFEVRIDGINEAALTLTGQDTRNAGSGIVDLISIGTSNSMGASVQYNIDDFYICDDSGSAPRNTFLGPVKIETLYPQTDAVSPGSDLQLTPSTGTDHGALVDENPPNTTDYNSGVTAGLLDLYQYPPMTLAGTVLGVQSNLYVMKVDVGVRTIASSVRTGSTVDGATVSPTTSFSYLSEIKPVDPYWTTEWTVAAVNGAQFGMKIVS